MAAYLEVHRFPLGGDGEARLEYTYQLPPGWDQARWEAGDPDDPTPTDGLTIDSIRVVNTSTMWACRFILYDARARGWDDRTLQPGGDFTRSGPFPGGVKEMTDLPGFGYQPLVVG